MTSISTEIIDHYNMTDAERGLVIDTFRTQGLKEFTVRLNAFGEQNSGTLSAGLPSLRNFARLGAANGMSVICDFHTWNSSFPFGSQNYLNYVAANIEALENEDIASFQLFNEPPAQTATAAQNAYLLSIIQKARDTTFKPVSGRFMGMYNCYTNHYSRAIDEALDYVCVNAPWVSGDYWNPLRNYPTYEQTLKNIITYAHDLGKQLWITEFGKQTASLPATAAQQESQRAAVAAMVTWMKNNGVDLGNCWVYQPDHVGTEHFNITNGNFVNYPAFYELLSDEYIPPVEPPVEPPVFGDFGVNWASWNNNEMQSTYPSFTDLMQQIGATWVNLSNNPARVLEATQKGFKVYIDVNNLIPNAYNPTTGEGLSNNMWTSKQAMLDWLESTNLQQYNNNPLVVGFNIAREPLIHNQGFDPLNMPQEIINVLEIAETCRDWLKQNCAGKWVSASLDSTPMYFFDPYWINHPDYKERWINEVYNPRKAWVQEWVNRGLMDVVIYHYYLNMADNTPAWKLNLTDWQTALRTTLDMLNEVATGRPVFMGEFGYPSGVTTETDQAEYYRIYGEILKEKSVLPILFKLVDAAGTSYEGYGVFKTGNVDTQLVCAPKIVAPLLKSYLGTYIDPHIVFPCPYNDGFVFDTEAELAAHIAAVHTTQPPPPPHNPSLGARVPYFGNRALVQIYLRKLRDKLISQKLHNRIHPLV